MSISQRVRRTRVGLAAIAAIVIADAICLVALPGHHHMDLAVQAPPAAGTGVGVAAPDNGIPASTLLASPQGTIPYSSTPGGPQAGTVGTWYGYNLVLPVLTQKDGYTQVRLPWRPNESTGWVQSSKVAYTRTAYYIRVSLTTEHLTVYKDAQQLMRFPIGIGLPATPTVTGEYFVAVHEPKPSALLGPVVLDLSAHSDAIQSWEGSGDAIIAIHGPVDPTADQEIGTTGARVSNGCIRLHTSEDQQMSVIPVGTPVEIIS